MNYIFARSETYLKLGEIRYLLTCEYFPINCSSRGNGSRCLALCSVDPTMEQLDAITNDDKNWAILNCQSKDYTNKIVAELIMKRKIIYEII